MRRRLFLGLCAMGSTSLLFSSEIKPKKYLSYELYTLIEAVQQHMFPGEGTIPSATSFNATQFLAETIAHPTYDRDIRKYLIRGAEELNDITEHKFTKLDANQKERVLREYEQTHSGGIWLNRIMLLSLEALLSDPIYGGNSTESGWRSLEIIAGNPRPTVRYAGL